MPKLPLIPILLAALPIANCDCVEPLAPLLPAAQIGTIGATTEDTEPLCRVEAVKDCAYDFGAVVLGEGRQLSFTIDNPARAALRIHSIGFVNDSDPSFTLQPAPPVDVPRCWCQAPR